MKCFLRAVSGFLLIGLSISIKIIPDVTTRLEKTVSELKTNNDTLIFAHVLYRHGKRNIVKQYPNDPYKDEIHWPGGIGQLTHEGKRQLYKLGKYFRKRYRSILGDTYSSNTVYTQSTDVDRALMSAQLNLAGLFYPTESEKWSEDVMWQPIPVHTVPKELDFILFAEKYCPKYKAILKTYMKESSEVKQIYTDHADQFLFWSQKSGSKISTINDVYYYHNTLQIEKEHNKTLPDWAENAIKPNGIMENIAKFNFKIGADTPQLARLKSGFLLKSIFERFSRKINSTLKPNRSLWLYSAHDYTISHMLNSLGLFKLHFPPYGCSLHFELFKTAEHEHYMQLFYNNSEDENPSPMNIPGCGVKCSLEKLYDLYHKIIPEEDFYSECRLN